MLISATGTRRPSSPSKPREARAARRPALRESGTLARLRGYTLIEVVVVLVLIGIVMSVAVVRLPESSAHLSPVQQIQRQFQMASEYATLSGRPVGLVLEGPTFGFVTWSGGEWHALDGQFTPASSAPVADVCFSLRRVRLKPAAKGSPVAVADPNTGWPPIEIHAHGEAREHDRAIVGQAERGR